MIRLIKDPWRISLIVLAITCLFSCTRIDIRTDFDHAINFNEFQTYAFDETNDVSDSDQLADTLVQKRLQKVIGEELKKKGIKQVRIDNDPDLIVNYRIGVVDKWALGRKSLSGESTISRAVKHRGKEGTLVIQLMESTGKDVVWRSTVIANLEQIRQENLEIASKAIRKAFANYPPSNESK